MESWHQNEDYLDFSDFPQQSKIVIKSIRDGRFAKLQDENYASYLSAVQNTSKLVTTHFKLNSDIVELGLKSDLHDENNFIEQLKAFIPWKKGPFNLFGTFIDSEWRSELKYNRLTEHRNTLEGKVVADIGCNNGYFMFRMLSENPKRVIGFEPYLKHFFAFQMMQNWLKDERLYFEPLGVEHISLYSSYFDTIFCLGILYHHTDPVGLLRKMRKSLKKGGEIIIDCQGISGDQPYALTPKSKYTKARGFWHLPTVSCLQNWITRAGFTKVHVFFDEKLDPKEQRSTEWAPINSLEDFLDPNNPEKTIEGYPAPRRFYVRVSH